MCKITVHNDYCLISISKDLNKLLSSQLIFAVCRSLIHTLFAQEMISILLIRATVFVRCAKFY